jgi:hypothetical protein
MLPPVRAAACVLRRRCRRRCRLRGAMKRSMTRYDPWRAPKRPCRGGMRRRAYCCRHCRRRLTPLPPRRCHADS